MDFGKFMAKLRVERGLTQQGLADLAQISTPSIQRGEASKTCPYRRSNATSILHALESVAPLAAEERAEYLKLSGLEVFARIAADYAAKHAAEIDEIKRRVAESEQGFDTHDDPQLTTAIEWVWRLMDTADPTQTLAILRAAAALARVELPDAVSINEKYRPFWTRSRVTQKATKQPALPVIPGATKIVHADGSVVYAPNPKPDSGESRKRRTS